MSDNLAIVHANVAASVAHDPRPHGTVAQNNTVQNNIFAVLYRHNTRIIAVGIQKSPIFQSILNDRIFFGAVRIVSASVGQAIQHAPPLDRHIFGIFKTDRTVNHGALFQNNAFAALRHDQAGRMNAFFEHNITFAAFVNIRRVCENGKGALKSVDFDCKEVRTVDFQRDDSAVFRSTFRMGNTEFIRTNFHASERLSGTSIRRSSGLQTSNGTK